MNAIFIAYIYSMPINIKFIDFSLFYMLLLHAFDISFCNYKIATYYIFIPVYLLWVYCDFCKFVKEHFAQDWERVINVQDST